MTHAPAWFSRPLLNIDDVYRWGEAAGIKKMNAPDQLHTTLATVRIPVSWDGIELDHNELVIPEGPKPIQIFGNIIKAFTFTDERITARHTELLQLWPQMDHPRLRPHVSLFKGGRMPRLPYEGRLVFGPERLIEFNAVTARDTKHVLVADQLR